MRIAVITSAGGGVSVANEVQSLRDRNSAATSRVLRPRFATFAAVDGTTPSPSMTEIVSGP